MRRDVDGWLLANEPVVFEPEVRNDTTDDTAWHAVNSNAEAPTSDSSFCGMAPRYRMAKKTTPSRRHDMSWRRACEDLATAPKLPERSG